jgi:hypothetical protein
MRAAAREGLHLVEHAAPERRISFRRDQEALPGFGEMIIVMISIVISPARGGELNELLGGSAGSNVGLGPVEPRGQGLRLVAVLHCAAMVDDRPEGHQRPALIRWACRLPHNDQDISGKLVVAITELCSLAVMVVADAEDWETC